MNRLLLLIAFLTAIYSCRKGKPDRSAVVDQKSVDTKQLVIQIVKENSQNGVTTYVIDSVTTFPDNKNLFIDTILSKKQIDGVHQEIREWKNGVWPKNAFDYVAIISKRCAYSLVKTKKDICYLQFSRPLFTRDGQYCIMDVEFHHPNSAFFYDDLNLYHKVSGKWKKVFTYSETIA